MGDTSARVLVDKASILLTDKTKAHWTDSELLGWLNDGQLAVVQFRPDACTHVRSQALVAGTKQTLEAADILLLDVVRNMGSGGVTPGRAIRWIKKTELDESDRDWHSRTANAVVRSWVYDPRFRKVWYCYPQQPSSPTQVEILTSRVPVAMTLNDVDGETADTNLGIDDIWLNPLLQFVVYRAYSKDAEETQIGGKADAAWREFLQLLGVDTETNKQFIPDQSQPPHYDPNIPGTQGAFVEN